MMKNFFLDYSKLKNTEEEYEHMKKIIKKVFSTFNNDSSCVIFKNNCNQTKQVEFKLWACCLHAFWVFTTSCPYPPPGPRDSLAMPAAGNQRASLLLSKLTGTEPVTLRSVGTGLPTLGNTAWDHIKNRPINHINTNCAPPALSASRLTLVEGG